MSEHRSIHALLRLYLVLAIVVPTLVVSLVGAGFYVNREFADARGRLADTAQSIAHQVETYLTVHLQSVGAIAQLAERGRLETTDRYPLDVMRELNPGFLTAFIADAGGRVVSASPDRTPEGGRLTDADENVSDRHYFQAVMARGKPYVSNGFEGRGFGTDPIVAVAWPVHEDGEVTAMVEGSLDLDLLQVVVEDFSRLEGLEVAVLDREGRTVFGSAAANEVLQTWMPGKDLLHGEAAVPRYGWQTKVTIPRAIVLTDALQFLAGALLLVVVGMGAAAWAAARLAHRVVGPIDQLVRTVDAFELGEDVEPRLAADAPREIRHLAGSFGRMSERLHRTLAGIIPICASCKKIRSEQNVWQPLEVYLGQRAGANFSHGLCPDCAERWLRE